MKGFIVVIASFLIMWFFPLQFAVDTYNNHQRETFNNIVKPYIKEARKEGYFTPDIINNMRQSIEDKLYINQAEILVTATTSPRYRKPYYDENEMIYYKIEIPINKIMAMPSYFGIDEENNRYLYPIEGFVSSERIP